MVLCLLISRLAEHRLRQRLQQSEQTIPKKAQQTNGQTNHALGFPMPEWEFPLGQMYPA
jgi:hypothetical protein